MFLDILPSRSDSAPGNMAADFLLLQRYPAEDRARFRHYGWHRPAVTFGFSQKIAWVREQVDAMQSGPASDHPVEFCRRPTGGGIVDHRDDWTYALVLPRVHPLVEGRAVDAYRMIHTAVAAALAAQGVPVALKQSCEPEEPGSSCAAPGVCFARPELHDVVHAQHGAKIAGAALKRNKRGLLVQGSLWRPAAGAIDWDGFAETFANQLAQALEASAESVGWPDFADDEQAGLTEQYASVEWIEQR